MWLWSAAPSVIIALMHSPDGSSRTVVVAAPQPLISAAIASLLDSNDQVEVRAQCDGPGDALRYVRGHKPDVLLFAPDGDSHLPVLQALPEASPDTAALALLSDFDPLLARQLMQDGVHGVVAAEESPDDLFSALHTLASGDGYVSPRMAIQLAHVPGGLPGGLSEREVEILSLIALGYTNQEISKQLFLSVRTVESHRAHILEKLNMKSRHELVRFALEHRLMDRRSAETD